ARCWSDVCATSTSTAASRRKPPAAAASSRPFSERSTSTQPVKRFSLFHTLSPCRSRTRVGMVAEAIARPTVEDRFARASTREAGCEPLTGTFVRVAGGVLPRIQVEEGRTMQKLLSQRRARSAATVAAALSLLAMLVMAALPSSATTTGFVPNSGCQMTLITGKTFNTCVGPVMRISGSTPTKANVNDVAGLIEFNLDGKTTFMYCIDL